MAKATINFQTWVKTIARARGKASAEVLILKEKFPTYKNDKMYATKFPKAFTNYTNYCNRGSQSKKAA